MRPGDLLRVIHMIHLEEPRVDSWRTVIYLCHEDIDYGGTLPMTTIRVLDSDGCIENYPIESFYFEAIR